MLEEPRSGRLTAWGNALLAGEVAPDDAVDRIIADDAGHRVTDMPGESGAVGLSLALGRLRALGACGLRLALPVPGHPLGLSGPPEFNAAALEAGEAVTVAGAALGLVPQVHRSGAEAAGRSGQEAGGRPLSLRTEVVWRCLPVRAAPPADVPSLGDAERELAQALRETTEGLTALDAAGSGPVANAALDAYRARSERGRRLLAPGYPARAVRVLELAQRVGALVAIAETGHGSALSASQMGARAELLRPLERTARRAQVAAYNAYAEELERKRRG